MYLVARFGMYLLNRGKRGVLFVKTIKPTGLQAYTVHVYNNNWSFIRVIPIFCKIFIAAVIFIWKKIY